MIRVYFAGQDVPGYLVWRDDHTTIKFSSIFTVVYKKDGDFYINGFFGSAIIKAVGKDDSCCVLNFHPQTYIRKII